MSATIAVLNLDTDTLLPPLVEAVRCLNLTLILSDSTVIIITQLFRPARHSDALKAEFDVPRSKVFLAISSPLTANERAVTNGCTMI